MTQLLSTGAAVVAHSISRADKAIATLALTYPRFIHSEAKTHRALSIGGDNYELLRDVSVMDPRELSRNAMSSRAVPIQKMIDQVRNNPASPVQWGRNQPGMQAGGDVDDVAAAQAEWLAGAREAADRAERMMHMGLHKQIVNRVLEPYQWMHTIVTSTEWENFFALRLATKEDGTPFADPTMFALASCMNEALKMSTPVVRDVHHPYFDAIEYMHVKDVKTACMVSAARCARVSYLNHDGTAPQYDKDLALAELLMSSNHASPFEHIAFAGGADTKSRNFTGWTQFREVVGL